MIDLSACPISLDPSERRKLEELARQLPLIAELSACELFIDCVGDDGGVVVAHAWSNQLGSFYAAPAVGKHVSEEKEPAVFAAWRTGLVQRDLKAVTQEDRTVWQDVVPVYGSGRRCIALLIREKDISERVARDKKYAELAKSYAEEAPTLRDDPSREDHALWQREIHHRVKNNLQTVASILSMQSRRCKDETAANILRENVERVLSMATIHDILLKDTSSSQLVDSNELLENLIQNLQAMVPVGKSIALSLEADHVLLLQETASGVAMVVCELVTNALKHAFAGRDSGSVRVVFARGVEHHTVSVSDDGIGFNPEHANGFGLQIVQATVAQKLHGCVSIVPLACGTTVTFDCKAE